MLFKQKNTPELADELFKNPTAEYRGAPFWSWNCKLDEKELLRQIGEMREMGFGGFHIHCRSGMATEYLSEEFMSLVKACVKKAKKEDMFTWLYDEDRWPSGFAGGIVTKDKQYRGRSLIFSPNPYAPPESKVCGEIQEKPHLDLGRFDIVFSDDGTLRSYRRLMDGEEAEGETFYAYVVLLTDSTRYNNQSYVDTLNRDAIKRFIEVTHEAYKKAVGREFDKSIPAIFTDEPAFRVKKRLEFATDRKEVALPFTDDLEMTYEAKYGESLVEHLPELFWDLEGGVPSVTRYRYHAHVAERFAEAFADQIGAWCGRNGLALTGHLRGEGRLGMQTSHIGEAMLSYRGFQIPGIDVLWGYYDLNTAKQCQSAVRQYGREAMMSELYGVTTWDFDFRGYKLAGDWQAAMGVTVRVPHLSWVSMEGQAKRDYPATFSYQSPWYKKFSYVEDHFARLNTALSRGKAVVRIGVIHPIESYWLHFGPQEQSALATENLESNFADIVKWLSFGGYDFDYICETTLPEQCEAGSMPLCVGKMAYDVVIVPACETLRKTTVERLKAFRCAGGKLIFMGSAPKWMDAVESDEPRALYEMSERISFSRSELIEALEPFREVEIRNKEGAITEDMLYQMREDNGDRWLFICKGAFPIDKDQSSHSPVTVRIRGLYSAQLYDTLSGEIRDLAVTHRNGKTEIVVEAYDYDSFLFRLSPAEEKAVLLPSEVAEAPKPKSLPVESLVPFTLQEPNALLLDMAEFKLDDGAYNAREELLRADTRCRKALGWPRLSGGAAQPWSITDEPITHKIHLRFRVNSEIRYFGAMLALENPERAEIVWNGKPLLKKVKGYYVDRSIKTLKLPVINKGENILELTLPFGKRTATEWCYILGDFGTRVVGDTAVITALPKALGFSTITSQGLSFYSGALDYHFDVDVPEDYDGAELSVRVPQYRGTVVETELDKEKSAIIAYAPYKVSLGRVSAGSHRVTVRLYVPRTNGFGPVHLASECYAREGCPDAWRTAGDLFAYEYHLKCKGVLMKPQITLVK